ncbi:hypothetical protein FOA43_002341 [Brettanomyces nanus]|uniref:TRAM domain-containing protein n=1 Tax=Eeniella nana TaxID=13502 RepID=A0A875RZP0_EENNA|nr:uncharacterized protein FOA43_002341 [Brettanomyces nanus]QPG75001.1 hypothetical protein FOA43_002341 [Brettanomyces nanus]
MSSQTSSGPPVKRTSSAVSPESVLDSSNSSTAKKPKIESTHKRKSRRGRKGSKRQQKQRQRLDPDPTTTEGVLTKYTIPLLMKQYDNNHGVSKDQLIVNDGTMNWLLKDQVVDNVKILIMDVQGDGVAIVELPSHPDKKVICVIPFGIPGDIVKIKLNQLIRIENGIGYCKADLLHVINPSQLRLAEDQIPCKYFGICSGCQLQSLDYSTQLQLKRRTIVNAYRFLMDESLRSREKIEDKIGQTVGSPLLVGYRTKLTPHYDLLDMKADPPKIPSIGYEAKGRPEWRVMNENQTRVVDIEDCIIGTPIVRKGLANERTRLSKKFDQEGSIGKKGATILLREDTVPKPDSKDDEMNLNGSRDTDHDDTVSTIPCIVKDQPYIKTCVTDHNSTVHEYVNGLEFRFLANEFFQNNNSILPLVIDYVQKKLNFGEGRDSYLVDAYCGSGLFSISSAKSVKRILGVEISAQSIKFAKLNAELNHIDNCEFIAGKAEKLFDQIDFPRDQTSVILDPPRKGCDKVFLDQLSQFLPKRVVYVSCNVHSQARDIQSFLTETENGSKYHVESIRGFDFFPQTYHVESVAVLERE